MVEQTQADTSAPAAMSVALLPPSRSERRLAIAVVALSAIAFAVVAPLARRQLAPLVAFIPIYQTALVVNDLVTALLLFGQFNFVRRRSVLVLACGYLFTAAIAAVHLLSFPALFSASGLLGAGPQTTAWLYMFWHAGFPACVVAYAWLKRKEAPTGSAGRGIAIGLTTVLITVAALSALSTAGQQLLPGIMQGNSYTPAMIFVVSAVWGCSLIALAALWLRRPHSVLDLWLMVVMCAWIFDIALSAVLNAGRYDAGFYAGRIYGLLAAMCVLVVLLLENGTLYARLALALEGERSERQRVQEKTAEVDALNASLEQRVKERTAELEVANQRIFEQLASLKLLDQITRSISERLDLQ